MLPLAREQSNTVHVRVEDGLPPIVTDPTRLLQILINLASNAAKFTDHGEIWLSARRLWQDDEPFLVIDVQDTGCGIPAEQLEEVFGKFVQLDDAATRRHAGSGLGLAICREMVRAMGGQLTARSQVGEGSTFTARLPWRSTAPEVSARAMPDVLQHRALGEALNS